METDPDRATFAPGLLVCGLLHLLHYSIFGIANGGLNNRVSKAKVDPPPLNFLSFRPNCESREKIFEYQI